MIFYGQGEIGFFNVLIVKMLWGVLLLQGKIGRDRNMEIAKLFSLY